MYLSGCHADTTIHAPGSWKWWRFGTKQSAANASEMPDYIWYHTCKCFSLPRRPLSQAFFSHARVWKRWSWCFGDAWFPSEQWVLHTQRSQTSTSMCVLLHLSIIHQDTQDQYIFSVLYDESRMTRSSFVLRRCILATLFSHMFSALERTSLSHNTYSFFYKTLPFTQRLLIILRIAYSSFRASTTLCSTQHWPFFNEVLTLMSRNTDSFPWDALSSSIDVSTAIITETQ